MTTNEQLHCAVLTPEGPAFEGDVQSVVAPGEDGSLGILRGHAPLVTSLGYGPLRLKMADGATEEWFLVGGFLEVFQNKVAVLARQIDRVEAIEVDEVRKEMDEARESSDASDAGDFDPAVVGRAKIRYAEAWAQAKRGY